MKAAPGGAAGGRAALRRKRERAYRRARWLGLAVSVGLHLVIAVVAARVHVDVAPYALPAVEIVPAPNELVIVDVEVVEPEESPEDPRPPPLPPEEEEEEEEDEREAPAPEREDEPEEPGVGDEAAEDEELQGVPVVVFPGQPEGVEGEEEAGRSNASRLTLRYSDARIWFDPRSPRLVGARLERFARADSAVRAILRDWLDSLRLDEDMQQRALDWTFERDGKRWGISPRGIHLGDITIPIPIGFAPSGPQRRAFEQALRDLTAIRLQDLRADIERATEEARERMRQRSEDEIRRRGGDTLRVRDPPLRL